MRFQAEMDYTVKDIRQYWKVHQLYRGKVLYYVSWLLIAVVLVLVITLGAMMLLRRIFSGDLALYYLIMLIVLAAYFVVREVRIRMVRRSLTAQGVVRLTADDQGLHARADTLSSDYSYQAFQDIVRYKEAYYLYIDKRKAMIVPDHCFTEGNADAFGPFLEQKTGISLRNIGA
ncbi:MAG: YcxB family protein [Oscillospiraceae bacterium]|nr:YcxB family protein [Oscillospiraceae bacterium]